MGTQHEREQIEALLKRPSSGIERGRGLFLMSQDTRAQMVYDLAVEPAIWKNDLNGRATAIAFHSDSTLADVCDWVMTSEIIVADVDPENSHLMYVLGLCHGMGRCPLLLARGRFDLPFNLREVRALEYIDTVASLRALRDELTRAIRVALMAGRAEKLSRGRGAASGRQRRKRRRTACLGPADSGDSASAQVPLVLLGRGGKGGTTYQFVMASRCNTCTPPWRVRYRHYCACTRHFGNLTAGIRGARFLPMGMLTTLCGRGPAGG